jgi:hypothetical protein
MHYANCLEFPDAILLLVWLKECEILSIPTFAAWMCQPLLPVRPDFDFHHASSCFRVDFPRFALAPVDRNAYKEICRV